MAGEGLRGVDRFVDTLDRAAREIEDLTETEHAVGELLATRGSRAAPRRTGRLSAEHGYAVVGDLISVTARTPYAVPVAARNPWLTRVVKGSAEDVADLYLTGIDRALATVEGI